MFLRATVYKWINHPVISHYANIEAINYNIFFGRIAQL